MTGIHRSTVIECVKKLRALKLLSPHWRYKEDGSHASNQYNFHAPEKPGASKKVDDSIHVHGRENSGSSHQDNCDKGSRPEPPPVVAQEDPPSRPEPPEQPSPLNKKNQTREIPVAPTEKQKTCPHPPSELAFLPAENLRICHHCWGLLDEGLTLITPGSATDAPANRASAECEPVGEPETKTPPVGKIPTTTGSETPVTKAPKSHQSASEEGKAGKGAKPLVVLGKLLTGLLRSA
jgi:hypothetical protein